LLLYLIGASRAAARQAEGEARGEPVGNDGTAVRRLSTALRCGAASLSTGGRVMIRERRSIEETKKLDGPPQGMLLPVA
jgi:hypothetical protein